MSKQFVSSGEIQVKNARIIRGSDYILVKAETDYILNRDFITIFSKVGEMIKEEPVEKVVFDKTSLSVFNQESMEWYYLVWKVQMLSSGLKKHYKILPNDETFVKMVNLCKESIYKKMPADLLEQMEIKYFHTMEEAINK